MEEKELTKWQKIKKAWKEPKTHALMSLGLYAIFFTSIFLVVKIRGLILDAKYDKPNIEYEKVEVIDEYKELDNYEYKYTITKNNDIYVLNGTVYKNKEKLKEEGNNKIYYLNDESEIYPQEYIDLENKLGINLTYLNPEYIYNYIKISKLIDSTEYKDSTKKEIYEISIKDLKELFKINVEKSNALGTLTVLSDRNNINSIEISFINNEYFKTYKVLIEYSNVENVRDFDINQ